MAPILSLKQKPLIDLTKPENQIIGSRRKSAPGATDGVGPASWFDPDLATRLPPPRPASPGRAGSDAERARDRRARAKEAGTPIKGGGRATQTERQRRSRANARAAGKPSGPSARPVPAFVGVDGEGAGTDALGRQHYLLLRAGDAELYDADNPLSTVDCLDFLLSLDRKALHVGFSFGYDATMILRDLPAATLERMFMPKETREKLGLFYKYTYWGDYAIEYMPRNYLRVARVDRKTNKIIKHSARTVYEVFGFFQKSFLGALKDFAIGTVEERVMIEQNKARRGDFATMGSEERAYCATECRLLAELMTRFRTLCWNAGIRPRTWNGAGKLAAAMHTVRKTLKRPELEELVPAECLRDAHAAYYGGRFEITRTGRIEGPIYEYDINSAYPAAMLTLPCLIHGAWRKLKPGDARSGVYLSSVRFRHDPPSPPGGGKRGKRGKPGAGKRPLCGLPWRKHDGRLYYPMRGSGTYWGCEIDAAERLGCQVEHGAGWQHETRCDCKPFAWVAEMYAHRRTVAAEHGKPAGIPIKLAINSLYGQLARRAGGPGPWTNFLWAGLITAKTRAALARAASQCPEQVVMLATDGIYATKPLTLDVGAELGQWEHKQHPGMFVVMPGLYWGPPMPKTRGVPQSAVVPHIPAFEASWGRFLDGFSAANRTGPWTEMFRQEGIGCVTVPLVSFTGLKLAFARGKPDTAGRWTDAPRTLTFDWTAKRQWEGALREGDSIRHWPWPGEIDLVSHVHRTDTDDEAMTDIMTSLAEAMPDEDMRSPGFTYE